MALLMKADDSVEVPAETSCPPVWESFPLKTPLCFLFNIHPQFQFPIVIYLPLPCVVAHKHRPTFVYIWLYLQIKFFFKLRKNEGAQSGVWQT